jgi:hypothetical protein
VVHDLGAGSGALSRVISLLGAKHVIALDMNPLFKRRYPRVTRVCGHFLGYHEPVDTALVSWPYNGMDSGLPEIIDRARVVIYLGKNTDGTACGTRQFWDRVTRRQVLAHEPDQRNTLIVYGEGIAMRMPLPEEAAAGSAKVMSHNEAHGLVPSALGKGIYANLQGVSTGGCAQESV